MFSYSDVKLVNFDISNIFSAVGLLILNIQDLSRSHESEGRGVSFPLMEKKKNKKCARNMS